MSAASLAFRIIYHFFYYFLYLVLLVFLLVTPADLINQAIKRKQSSNILVIAICYLVTVIIICFIYATRLYINRSVLASIPKSWIPIEKDDVNSDVRQMIVEGISRSAAIAFEARPRVPSVFPIQQLQQQQQQQQGSNIGREEKEAPTGTEKWSSWRPKLWKSVVSDDSVGINIPPRHRAVWGDIEHLGWAPPTSLDLPNLQYDTVVLELPNLIEAKALTLAPPDPESQADPPALDPEAVALLQRPDSMGLREYLTHLTEVGVLAPLPMNNEFIAKYEGARFSARPISNEQFRALMHLFAEILRNMYPLSPAVLAQYDDDDDSSSGLAPSESDIDNDAPRRGTSSSASSSTAQSVRGPRRSPDGGSLPRGVSSSTASSGLLRPAMQMRNSSANTWQYRTAPTTPKSRHTGLSRASSPDSFAQTRRPYPVSQTSTVSLRSSAGGSVIRLAGSEDDTDLPYVLMHPHTQ
ncbi:hypothetical protein B0H63DRAFT_470790 [Podospora didyma]|uniref:Defect at low temperature protein 1 n=1 Tax=Podospora didyma TaxID=330526 RepID=A0AAE0NU03_9PEZI|nr:hypothetical protein B0H63DRAFT_470790 [Podospora didyma]